MANESNLSGSQIRDLFRKNLTRLRKEVKLSQLDLAAKTGLTHTFINDIENGKKWVSCKTLAKICSVLHVEPSHFFLPLSKGKQAHSETLSAYIDELPLMIQKGLEEFKNRYLRD